MRNEDSEETSQGEKSTSKAQCVLFCFFFTKIKYLTSKSTY